VEKTLYYPRFRQLLLTLCLKSQVVGCILRDCQHISHKLYNHMILSV